MDIYKFNISVIKNIVKVILYMSEENKGTLKMEISQCIYIILRQVLRVVLTEDKFVKKYLLDVG